MNGFREIAVTNKQAQIGKQMYRKYGQKRRSKPLIFASQKTTERDKTTISLKHEFKLLAKFKQKKKQNK